MKKGLILILNLILLFGTAYGQQKSVYGKLRTIEIHTMYISVAESDTSGYGGGNSKINRRARRQWNNNKRQLNHCKPCNVQLYDKNDKLESETVSYTDIPVGAIAKYYPSGQLKVKGQYVENASRDWETYLHTGTTKHADGEWVYYDENGNKLYSEFWDNGRFIKQVPEQNKVERWKVMLTLNGKEVTDSLVLTEEMKDAQFEIVPLYKNAARDTNDFIVDVEWMSQKMLIDRSYTISNRSSFNLNKIIEHDYFKYVDNPIVLDITNRRDYEERFQIHVKNESTVPYEAKGAWAGYRDTIYAEKKEANPKVNLNLPYSPHYLVNSKDSTKRLSLKLDYMLEYEDIDSNPLLDSRKISLNGHIYELRDNQLDFLTWAEYGEEHYTNGSSITYTNYPNGKIIKTVDLKYLTSITYDKPFRTTLHDVAPIIIGLSAATTLLAAPLASLNYKTGDFNMKRYFTIAGSGLIGVSIGVPLYLFTQPKTYKLNTGEWHFE